MNAFLEMYRIYVTIGALVGTFATGFVVGMLVMRNNYKHFVRDEDVIKKFILDKRLNAEQTVLKIRNILKV